MAFTNRPNRVDLNNIVMMIIIYNEGATLIKDNFQEGRQNKINEKLKMIQRDI